MNIYVVYSPNGVPIQAFESRKDAKEFAQDDLIISGVPYNKHIVIKTLDELWNEWRFTNEWKAACQCTTFEQFLKDRNIEYIK